VGYAPEARAPANAAVKQRMTGTVCFVIEPHATAGTPVHFGARPRSRPVLDALALDKDRDFRGKSFAAETCLAFLPTEARVIVELLARRTVFASPDDVGTGSEPYKGMRQPIRCSVREAVADERGRLNVAEQIGKMSRPMHDADNFHTRGGLAIQDEIAADDEIPKLARSCRAAP
jgi:hypothetical protein